MSTVRRRIIALFAIPLLLVLSACKLHMEFVIVDETQLQVNMDLSVTAAEAQTLEVTAEDLCALGEEDLEGEEEVDVVGTPYEAGGQIGCHISMTGPLEDTDGTVTLDGDVWTFTMPSDSLLDGTDPESPTGMADFDMQIMVTFPGEVLSHSGNSTVEDTTVIWADQADLEGEADLTATARNEGIAPQPRVTPPGDTTQPEATENPLTEEPTAEETATQEASPLPPGTDEATEPEATDDPAAEETEEAADEATTPEGTEATVDDDGGFPVWGWILIGVIVLGAIAAAVAVSQRNKGDDASGGPGGPGAPGGPGDNPDWGQAPQSNQTYGYGQQIHDTHAQPMYPGHAGHQPGPQGPGGYPPPPPQNHPLEGTPHQPPSQQPARDQAGQFPGPGPRPPQYPGTQPEQYLGHGQPQNFPGQGGLDSASGNPPGRDAPTQQFPAQGQPQQPGQGPSQQYQGSDDPTQEFPRNQETPPR